MNISFETINFERDLLLKLEGEIAIFVFFVSIRYKGISFIKLNGINFNVQLLKLFVHQIEADY